jgi:cell division protein FtsI/penicillin-binding protein 2
VREINRWVKLSEGVERDTLEAVQALGIRAVYGNPEHRRIYPAGASAAHLIGFINANGDGTGIEQYFDYYLQGQPGYRETERDGHRRELVRSRTREIAPTPGHTVRLSIDRNIQHIVESVLAEAVEEWQPKAATVIVSDPRSGFLHALANYPSFDLNVYGKSLPQERLNRAIAAVYEPGSTFKIVTVAAALDLGLVSEADIVKTSHGVVRYKGRKVRLPTDEGDYSELSVRDVLVKSSNRGAALLGMRMGAESLYTYTRAFGFGTPTRLGGYAEALWKTGFPEEPGLLNPPEQWDSLTITRLPIGYAVAATPLQVHMATCAVANGGLLHRPQVVERVSDHEGRLVMAFEPDVRRRVIAADTAARVREILREVTTPAGTAKRAAVPGYTTAGKTGTTQKVVQLGSERGYSSAHHIASFSGFLPAALPELAITVVIDEPQSDGPGFGGRYAAPIFRKVADDVARYLGIEADRNALTAINQKGGTYGHSR